MGKPVLSTPESEINCFAKLVDKQDCPRSSDIHYGLTMKYQVVEPLHSSSSSSSSSSHPSPSTFHSFSPTSNFILVIHGAPECPRESYFKHSGTLEAFNIGDIHKLRLKRKLNRTPSPFDKLVDPYENDPCQRYISLRVEPASQPILRNRSIFETLRLALRGRSLQFRFDETTQEGMEDDPELGARGHGFHFQSQQRGRDNNEDSNNNEEDDFDIRFFSSNRFDLAQMVQSILGRQISPPPPSRLLGRDFAIGPLSLNEDLEDDNEDDDDEDLEDEEQLREPLVGLDPMDDEDLSLFEGDDDEEDEEYDEEQDQDDEDDDYHGHAMDEEEEEEEEEELLPPSRPFLSSLVHRQISLEDDDGEEEEEDDEYDEEGDDVHGSRRAEDGDEDQNRRRGGGGGNGPQSASQRSYPYFHSTYF